jgi:hypothetical protein
LSAGLLLLLLHLDWLLRLPSTPREALHEFHQNRRPLEYRLHYDERVDVPENLRRSLDHARQYPGRYRS